MNFHKAAEKNFFSRDKNRYFRLLLWLTALLILICINQAKNENENLGIVSKERQISREEQELLLPNSDEIQGWMLKEPVSHYNQESLYGYINGGAEIFLQYDFKHLTQAVYSRNSQGANQELIIEIYKMDSGLDAFGIFSVTRSGGERVSEKINALNWTSPTQINFVKGLFFVNVLGFECSYDELESFASLTADKTFGEAVVPGPLDRFPNDGRIRGSEKYIRGPLAAVGESVLLQAQFWGFNQKTRAYSCRYHPHNSRAILLQFEVIQDTIGQYVEELFKEYLEEVETTGAEIKGKNAVGRFFIFNHSRQEAGLILGEESLETARSRLDKLLVLKDTPTAEN